MVASASGIRAGGAYVEITADDSPMVRRLKESQARLQQWVTDNSRAMGAGVTRATEGALGEGGARGFFSGSFRGAELFETGLRFATAIAATKAAVADVKIFSAAIRGDWEGTRKAAEELPFGLGQIVKELSGPVDAAMKALIFDVKGLARGGGYDEGAAARMKREQLASVAAFNQGNRAIAQAQSALDRATMSAREYARAEVEGLGLARAEAAKLLALKIRLIAVEEQRKAFAQAQAALDRGESAVGQAMDQYAKATMSERDFIAYEVRHMGLAEHHAQSLLAWRLAILDVTEKQAQAEKRLGLDKTLAETVENVRSRVAELRGAVDGLGIEEARAQAQVAEAVGAGLLSFQEAAAQADRIKAAFAELRAAQGAAATRKEGESLTESLRTPEERAREEVARYKELLESGAITEDTYGRAVRKALEDAAAAMPDAVTRTIGVRGTFSALEAGRLGAGGATDRIAGATEKTAKNTEKIARLAENLGVTFQ